MHFLVTESLILFGSGHCYANDLYTIIFLQVPSGWVINPFGHSQYLVLPFLTTTEFPKHFLQEE